MHEACALLLLVPLLLALPAAPPARAAAQEAPASGPQVVEVGVFVMNVGKFELSTGSFTVDFYLRLTSDRPLPEPSFEFMNGRASSVDRVVVEEKRQEFRIQANLYQNLSLKDYPFDRHRLKVLLEDRSRNSTKLVYRVNEADSGLDREVTVVGWDLAGTSAAVEEHDYGDEKYSRFEFGIELKRIVLTSILKAFLPAGFIVAIGLLGLLLLPDKVVPCLGMVTSALLGTVMFHLTITSQIPPVGYLTFADRFMMVSYLVLLACLVSTVVLMRHSDQKDDEEAMRVYTWSLRTIPPAALVLYLLAFLTR